MKRVGAVAVVGAMVVGGVYANGVQQANTLYRSQVQSCKRGNKVRITLHDFLFEAAGARLELAGLSHDPRVARANREAASHYRALAHGFHTLDCNDTQVVRHP